MKPVNEERLQKTAEFINGYERENGSSPTYREIRDAVGHSSLKLVFEDVKRLRDRGMIPQKKSGRGGLVPDERLQSGELENLQVLGVIHCGEPNEAIENITESYLLPAALLGKGRHFMLRAQGYSMTRRGIYPGDLLIIREEKAYTPKAKDVVVVAFDREDAAAKVVKRRNNRLYFCPDSDYTEENGTQYKEYPVTKGQVFGVVEFVIHDPRAI
jgi:repressor LexA